MGEGAGGCGVGADGGGAPHDCHRAIGKSAVHHFAHRKRASVVSHFRKGEGGIWIRSSGFFGRNLEGEDGRIRELHFEKCFFLFVFWFAGFPSVSGMRCECANDKSRGFEGERKRAGDQGAMQEPIGGEKVTRGLPLLAWMQVNISMVVHDAEALHLVRQLHCEFFEKPLANVGASDSLGDAAPSSRKSR